MSKARTQLDYSRRLLKVVQVLWQNPTRQFTTAQLAEIAHFSPFHFHRVYREMMGETVAATQQRLRLHFASRDLACEHLSQERVAQRAGYQSSAAFVRAFAAAYGVTPGAYRRQHLNALQVKNTLENTMYSIEFRTLSSPINLAARRHLGAYLKIGEAFSHLELAVNQLPLVPNPRWFGLFYDDPANVQQGIIGAELRSDACVEICEQAELPADFHKTQIPAGRYALIEHRGAYSELDRAYQWLIGTWLPQSGEVPLPLPGIELYLNDPCNTEPKDLRTEIWLAIAG
ncbi:AraC family transcriptional regulator [Chitinibacter sp. SCUT-21]|uniref:AraC family transcriptional regulator n=1 Tax=Chitinibacter sp. SCUT-21 TaxID=2970891 RepID=UPI0035A64FD8